MSFDFSSTAVATRRARVLELWALGYSKAAIAELVDLTRVRVHQIVSGR